MRTNGQVTVGEVTRQTGLTRKALRLYEESGLVRPTARTEAGYRLYDAKALRRLELLRRAKLLGLHLREMAEFLEVAEGCCDRSHPELVAMVEDKLTEIDQRMAGLGELRTNLQETLQRLLQQDGPAGSPDCDELLCTCSVHAAKSSTDRHRPDQTSTEPTSTSPTGRTGTMTTSSEEPTVTTSGNPECGCGCDCCGQDKGGDKVEAGKVEAGSVAVKAPTCACGCGT